MRDDRQNDEIRSLNIVPNFGKNAHGSVLISCGHTLINCSVMIEGKVPLFLKGKNRGWLAAEYSMLPASTQNRKVRDISKNKLDARVTEIQRIIGRSLRACVDFEKLGEKTIWVDCDVINADGGTRTASINGAFIAMKLAIARALERGDLKENPIIRNIAAVSVGMVDGVKLCDLDFLEDSNADCDINIVMDENYSLIEVQGTGEKRPFATEEFFALIDFAKRGIMDIFDRYRDWGFYDEDISCDR